MFSIEKTETFSKWYANLKDNQAKEMWRAIQNEDK